MARQTCHKYRKSRDNMTITPAARAEISDLLTVWCATLERGNAADMVALYAPDATLLPTISNQTRNTPAGMLEYFERFLTLQPRAKKHTQNISVYEKIAINSGVYSFHTQTAAGMQDLVCRFTFVYRKDQNGWRIIEHHSSMMPETL
jgi:uncharacterized protein (TIGR02246 family)